MKPCIGKPESFENRLEKENKVYSYLEKLSIDFLRLDHEAAMTMEACKEIDHALQVNMCKNLFLCNRQETDFFLLLMPGSKKFKTKELSSQIGTARLSFAKAEHMLKYLDIHPGAVSVLGLINDTEHKIQLLIDRDLLKEQYIGCHPCVNTSSIRMKTADLLEKILPDLGYYPHMVNLCEE